jgi:lipopolysaccharide assembly outer membrane protein LptD (OstA)
LSKKSLYTLLLSLTLLFSATLIAQTQAAIADTTAKKTPFLASKVHYFATDSSIILLQEKKVLLYHEAQVNYEDIELKAEHIIINWNDNTVYAVGVPDSLGIFQGNPIFTEGGKTYNCKSILYNFTSKKGKIKGMRTQDGDGYIHGDQLKKNDDNSMFIEHSKYTTCSADEPHFYIGAKKLKIIPGNKIISGPANLVIADIPTPLVVPFGLFPVQNKQSSGFIMPSYGYSPARGYNFRNGGWYFAMNDYFDLALRGDIFTLGSWKIKAQSAYKKKYAYNGNLSLSYSKNLLGEEGIANFEDRRDFYIKWSHKQDGKAHPNRRFNANVNAGSSTFNQYNANQNNDYLKNTLSSTVSYSYSWPSKPFNFSANLRHSQNTQTQRVSLSLPELNFNINSSNPFKRKISSGKQKWYEKIRMSYTANAKNQIETTDSLLFRNETLDQMKYGIKHIVPISSSFKVLKFINISPSANYTERWYFNRIEKSWNEESLLIETDTIGGMRAVRDFTTRVSMNTKIYGLYQFKSEKIKALRHVFTPSLSFSYRPDFSEDKFGYYDWSIADSTGNQNDVYSYFEEGIYSTAPKGKSGNLNLSIENNLELKIKTSNDSIVEYKKIALFKSLRFNGNYNLALDSFNLSNITFSGRTELLPKMNIKFNGTLNPYQIDEEGYRIEEFVWKDAYSLGRLTNLNFTINWSLKSSEKTKDKEKPENTSEQEWNMIQDNPGDYVDFNIPWNVGLDYSYSYIKPTYEKTIKQTFNVNGNVRLTEKWKIGFRSGYDFDTKKISYSSIDVYRDLHCWEMRFNWIPFGPRQSYNLSINVKSSVLQDLKLNKRKSFYDF